MISKVLLFVVAISACGSQADVTETPLKDSSQLRSESVGSDISGPSKTVQDLLALIASGENEKADAVFSRSERPAPRGNSSRAGNTLVEVPPRFDWVGYLSEGRWTLRRILSEKIDGESAEVVAELKVAHNENSSQRSIFWLKKEKGRWLVLDMDFTFDRTQQTR